MGEIMKKIIPISILIFTIIIILSLYKYNKTRYLYLDYNNRTAAHEINEVVKIEIYGLYLEGYNYSFSEREKGSPKTVITDRKKIQMLMDYLKNIPLKYVKEGENFDNTGGCSIFFYSNELQLGTVEINANSFIYNSNDVTTYKPKDKNQNIIFDIKKLGL